MEKTCRLVHITYRENNRGPGREEYKTEENFIFERIPHFSVHPITLISMYNLKETRLASRLLIVLLLFLCNMNVCHSMTVLNGLYFQDFHVQQRL